MDTRTVHSIPVSVSSMPFTEVMSALYSTGEFWQLASHTYMMTCGLVVPDTYACDLILDLSPLTRETGICLPGGRLLLTGSYDVLIIHHLWRVDDASALPIF